MVCSLDTASLSEEESSSAKMECEQSDAVDARERLRRSIPQRMNRTSRIREWVSPIYRVQSSSGTPVGDFPRGR